MITAEDAEVFELPEVRGVLVQNVTESGLAEKAGLQSGDVIYAIDGVSDRGGHLQQLIAEKAQGSKITVTVYRDTEPKDLPVTLGDAPVNGQSVDGATDVNDILAEVEAGEIVSFRLEAPNGLRRIVNIHAR